MTTQLLGLWYQIRSSYWFVPSLMLSGSVLLSFFMIELDESISTELFDELPWLYINEPEGARALLSTVAGSMITVAGVTFSITIVALTLASSQFGPRLLRNFMRNLGNQIVLGTFISTFMYCLLILRNVRTAGDEVIFMPHLSIALALVLVILNLAVLIYFIHHAAASIQISYLLAEVGRGLEVNIRHFFPESIGHSPPPERTPPLQDDNFVTVRAPRSGYIQTVDEEGLFELARTHDLLLKLHYRPGDFIVQDAEFLRVWPANKMTGALSAAIQKRFVVGTYRTPDQDLRFMFDQLVEVASRALSPGINDPYTALLCIDRIAAGLTLMSERKVPSAYRYDDSETLRVIAVPVSFESALTDSIGPIRSYGAASLLVVLRLFYALETVARRTHDEANRKVIKAEAARILNDARAQLANDDDRETAERAHRQVLLTMQNPEHVRT